VPLAGVSALAVPTIVGAMVLRPGSSVPGPFLDVPALHLAREYADATVAARLRAGRWERVGRGAYVSATPPLSPRARALARIAAVHENLRTPHWFSHESAALIWGLPLWRDPPGVHVRQEGHVSAHRDRSVFRHRGEVAERHLVLVGRLPVTDLEQTMVDCARRLSPVAGLVVADAALRAGADRALALGMLDELSPDPPSRILGGRR
jgi:predicted transcriptional regulator of viral defense system